MSGYATGDRRTTRERRTDLIAARVPPVLVVVTVDMRVLGWSPNSIATRLIADGGDDLHEAVRQSCARGTLLVHVTDDDVVLRIMPLESHGVECAVIMVESFAYRGSLAKAAETYRLTKRELEILEYVLQGLGNTEIAEMLYISHSTVADHVKNLLRKTHTTKRIHLLSKLAYREPD